MTKKKTNLKIQKDKFITRLSDIIIEEEGEKPKDRKKDESKNS